MKKLLTEGATELIEGFKGNEKEFSAKLKWDEKENRVQFVYS